MDGSVVWLILIAVVALGLYWLLERPGPRRNHVRDTPPPRMDSYGIPGAAGGAFDAGTPCDTGQGGGGDGAPGGN